MISALLPTRRAPWLAVALSLPWLAATISAQAQDRSAEVKKIVEEALASMIPAANILDVRWDGQVAVKPDGGRYAVSLPTLRLTAPTGERAELKGAALEMTPLESDRWRVQCRLFSPIRVEARDGKLVGQLSFERQRFSGLWVKGLKSFVETDGEVGGIAYTTAEGARPFTVASISTRRRYVEGKPGQWSGPDITQVEKLAIDDVVGMSLRLQAAAVESSTSGFDIAAAAKLAEQANLASAEPAPKKAKGKPAEKGARKDAKAIRQALNGMTIPLAAGSVSMRIEGFATKTDESGFAVEQALYETAIDGLDRERSTARLHYSHKGAVIVPAPTDPDFTPRTAEARLRLSNLPNAQLWQALLTFIGDMAERGADAAAATLAAKVPKMLSDAGVEFGLDVFKLDVGAAAADMSGVAVVEKNAVLGVAAGFNLVLTGLDAIIRSLKDGAVDEDVANVVLPVLTIIQALGQQGEPEKGRSVRRYRFEISADGQILLNGSDISQLFASFGRKEEKADPPRGDQRAPKRG